MQIPVGAWVWIVVNDRRHLAYTYVDPAAGLSAKGSEAGDDPKRGQVRALVEHPEATFRLARGGFKVTPLAVDEAARLRVPAEPPWMVHYQSAPSPWRSDPGIAPHLHPEHPDDVQASFYFPTERQVEKMWVRLTGTDDDIRGYHGTLLNEPRTKTDLAAGWNVTIRVVPGDAGPVAVNATVRENLRGWRCACAACGFDLLLETATKVWSRQFPDASPGDIPVAFTTRCARCGETMTVDSRAS